METYSELSEKLRELKEKGQIEYAIDTCDAIIALISNNKMKINLSSWKEEKASLILNLKIDLDFYKSKSAVTKDIKENIEKNIKPDWNEYLSLLMKANILESTNKRKSKELLYKCLIILKLDEQDFLSKYPNRKSDKDFLEKRLSKLMKF